MFIREICGKFTSFLFLDFGILIAKFQKSELGKFIPNFPFKHVITSTNKRTTSSTHWDDKVINHINHQINNLHQ